MNHLVYIYMLIPGSHVLFLNFLGYILCMQYQYIEICAFFTSKICNTMDILNSHLLFEIPILFFCLQQCAQKQILKRITVSTVYFSWRREWWAIHTLIFTCEVFKDSSAWQSCESNYFSFSFYSDGMIHEDWTFMLMLHIWNVNILIQKGFVDSKTLCKNLLSLSTFVNERKSYGDQHTKKISI
jgi:hypothetical protein